MATTPAASSAAPPNTREREREKDLDSVSSGVPSAALPAASSLTSVNSASSVASSASSSSGSATTTSAAEQELLDKMTALYAQLETVRRQKDELVEAQLKSVAKTGARVLLVSRRLPFVLQKRQQSGGAPNPANPGAGHAMAAGGNTTTVSWSVTDVSDLDTRNQSLQNLIMVEEIRDCLWVGWPGIDVAPADQPKLRDFLLNPRPEVDDSGVGGADDGNDHPPQSSSNLTTQSLGGGGLAAAGASSGQQVHPQHQPPLNFGTPSSAELRDHRLGASPSPPPQYSSSAVAASAAAYDPSSPRSSSSSSSFFSTPQDHPNNSQQSQQQQRQRSAGSSPHPSATSQSSTGSGSAGKSKAPRGQSGYRYLPVFLGAEDEKLFYAGFCKQILWPLFHSSPPTTEDMIMAHAFEESGSSSDFFEGSGDLSGGGGGGGGGDGGGGQSGGGLLSSDPLGASVAAVLPTPMKEDALAAAAASSLDAGLPSSEEDKAGGVSAGGPAGSASAGGGDGSSSSSDGGAGGGGGGGGGDEAGGGGGSGDWNNRLWNAYVSVNQTFAQAIRDAYENGLVEPQPQGQSSRYGPGGHGYDAYGGGFGLGSAGHGPSYHYSTGGVHGLSTDSFNPYRLPDLIWVQDYHLLLLPQMLRTMLPSAKIGFFLHVPFPSSELYRIMPYREELLVGLLNADLIGFQNYDYARHFLSACETILFCETSPQGVEFNDHFTAISICPVGIEPEAVAELARSAAVERHIRIMRRQFSGRKVMLGIDNLDATKGLVHKFLAVEELFAGHPDIAAEVTFVQVGIKRGYHGFSPRGRNNPLASALEQAATTLGGSALAAVAMQDDSSKRQFHYVTSGGFAQGASSGFYMTSSSSSGNMGGSMSMTSSAFIEGEGGGAADEQSTLESQINQLVTRINSSMRTRAGRVDLEDPIQYMTSQNMTVEQIYA